MLSRLFTMYTFTKMLKSTLRRIRYWAKSCLYCTIKALFPSVKLFPINRANEEGMLHPVNTFSEYPYHRGFDKYQCIFIHIPKNAGNTVLRQLGCYGTHEIYRYYQEKDKQRFERYYKFSIVRNPWDRVVSAWSYLKGGGMHLEDKILALRYLGRFNNFNDFIVRWINEKNIYKIVNFHPQYTFICDAEKNIKMDFLIRYEELDEGLAMVNKKLSLGWPEKLPCRNPSSREKSYQDYYSEESKQIVANVYQTDIEMFGYKF